jgi:hypothetical protein
MGHPKAEKNSGRDITGGRTEEVRPRICQEGPPVNTSKRASGEL